MVQLTLAEVSVLRFDELLAEILGPCSCRVVLIPVDCLRSM